MFEGWLLSFGGVKLPSSYIQMSDQNTQTPNQREELEAYRDDYSRDLHRVTANGKKTKMTFRIRSLNETQMAAFRAVMAHGLIDADQRKYEVQYWNDETLDYEWGDFYIPDITYIRQRISDGHIYYAPFDLTLVEY